MVCKVIFWLSHAKPLFLWDQQWDADEVWWDLWEVCSTKLLIAESSWPVSVISLSLVGGDMLPGKGYHHGLVWNQILLSQPLTSLLYDIMWKLTWISAWGQCLPLSGEYEVSLRSRTSLYPHYRACILYAWMYTHTHTHFFFQPEEKAFWVTLFSALLFVNSHFFLHHSPVYLP